jgi:hypothetical protein
MVRLEVRVRGLEQRHGGSLIEAYFAGLTALELIRLRDALNAARGADADAAPTTYRKLTAEEELEAVETVHRVVTSWRGAQSVEADQTNGEVKNGSP